MNLKNYTTSQLQLLQALLVQCVSEGVTDVRTIQEGIRRQIIVEAKPVRVQKIKNNIHHRKTIKRCPLCGKVVYPVIDSNKDITYIDNVILFGCGGKNGCRWSGVII